jgi:sensor histidine kinase YesM
MNKQLILNDRVVKLIGIPALGLIVPNLTGLIDNRLYTFSELAASYLFFIVVAFLVWEGNVRLMYYIRAKIPWSKRSYYRVIIALFFANIVYSGILSASFLRLWVLASHEARTDNDHLVSSVLVIIIAACFITNIYEILFLNLEKEYNESRVEQLNIAKAQAELEALKNQIDPHFEFSERKPMAIDVSISADYVIVRNVMNRRADPQPTSKIGLSNLDNRYKLLTKRNIQVENNFESFIVKLPIIRF